MGDIRRKHAKSYSILIVVSSSGKSILNFIGLLLNEIFSVDQHFGIKLNRMRVPMG